MNDAWFYRIGEQQHGPIPLAELRRLVAAGQLAPTVPVWRDGMNMWVPASNMGLVDDGGLKYIIPTSQTSGTSLAAGYLAILAIFVIPLAPVAVLLGVLGLRDLKQHPEKNGWGRAMTGIVLGGLLTLTLIALGIAIAMGK